MAFSICWSTRLALITVLLGGICQRVAAQTSYSTAYCATFNTADTARNVSIFQTNSLCVDFCTPRGYAFAVVQWQGCWCSNYAPDTSTTGCDQTCPGWQPEQCGNIDPVRYQYVSIPAGEPSGTRGASTAAPTPTPTSRAEQDDTTTPSPPRTTPSSSPSPSSPTWTPTPITSLQTSVGQVRTVTVTPTEPPTPQATNAIVPASGGGGGLGTGGAVGLTVGLVALAAIIAAAIFFFLRKRRQERAASLDNVSRRGSSAGLGAAAIPSRTMSENSRYVLGTDGSRVVETWEPEVRQSRLIPVDQRLDPFSAVYQRGDNKSRESVNTIRDDHDYSRRMVTGGTVLRATNPD